MPRDGVWSPASDPVRETIRAGPAGADMVRLPRRRRLQPAPPPLAQAPRVSGAKAAWARQAKSRLKAELVRANVRYAELAERLTLMGLPETEGSLQVKISRGVFSAWFLLAAMRALGAETLRLD